VTENVGPNPLLDVRCLGRKPAVAQMMHPRLISKGQAKMVANAGGLVGVWIHLADTPSAYARNIRALVDVIGVAIMCSSARIPSLPSPALAQVIGCHVHRRGSEIFLHFVKNPSSPRGSELLKRNQES